MTTVIKKRSIEILDVSVLNKQYIKQSLIQPKDFVYYDKPKENSFEMAGWGRVLNIFWELSFNTEPPEPVYYLEMEPVDFRHNVFYFKGGDIQRVSLRHITKMVKIARNRLGLYKQTQLSKYLNTKGAKHER